MSEKTTPYKTTLLWAIVLLCIGVAIIAAEDFFTAQKAGYAAHIKAVKTRKKLSKKASALKVNQKASPRPLTWKSVRKALRDHHCGKGLYTTRCTIKGGRRGTDMAYHVTLCTPYYKRALQRLYRHSPHLKARVIHSITLAFPGEDAACIDITGRVLGGTPNAKAPSKIAAK